VGVVVACGVSGGSGVVVSGGGSGVVVVVCVCVVFDGFITPNKDRSRNTGFFQNRPEILEA
jgi:hypothetical protein